MTYNQIQQEKSPIKRKALTEQAYLIYFNDFLTVDCFAQWLGCTYGQALEVIGEGKHWNNLPKIVAIEA